MICHGIKNFQPLWNSYDFREHLFLALKLTTKASRFLSLSKDDSYTFSVFLFNIIKLFIFFTKPA